MHKFSLGMLTGLGAALVLLAVIGPKSDRADTTSASPAPAFPQPGLSTEPLKRRHFAEGGFSVQAPSDWAMLTGDDLKTLAEARGKDFDSVDQIVGILVYRNVEHGRDMVVFARDKVPGTPLEKLEKFDIGVSWARMLSAKARNATVTTAFYAHALGGLEAASMVMSMPTQKRKDGAVGITMIDTPGTPLTVLTITNSVEQRKVAEMILASFTLS